ncbi:MAG: MoxR family ATPase [Bacteroidetes bacterium]|nr:MoxR family ATPase [Bacteroidota bacterium]
MSVDVKALNERIHAESAFVDQILREVARVIVGQKAMVERLLVALFSNGHVILEGVPGLAKTLAIKTVAQTVATKFQRLQFTPDLLPADLLGTLIYNQKDGTFFTRKGPIFANLILADEINRSPAKVQSALLEAMQERQVTISDTTFPLPDPFLVLATQNPIEQEGTYPLPEAQVDRFMMKLKVGYPTRDEELEIMRRMAKTNDIAPIQPVIQPEDILRARQTVNDIYVDEKIENYVVDIVFATREPEKYGLSELKPLIEFGASPRASINLILAAKAFAFIKRRGYVIPEDLRALALDILRHRVILTYEAEAEELTSEEVITQILTKIEVP